jgi:hypothetical protein
MATGGIHVLVAELKRIITNGWIRKNESVLQPILD